MATAAQHAKKIVNQTALVEARGDSDTFRVWENFREQAAIWRGIALIQAPATFIALIFAMVMWFNKSIILNVPAKPLPGMYAAKDVPDTEFIDAATNFLNLVESYQDATAKRQFEKAMEYVREPYLTRFRSEILETELKTVLATNRTQMFFPDPTKTTIEREDNVARITFVGERSKLIAGRELKPATSRFTITMTTVPRNVLNPYGIVVTDFSAENV